jgi:hypothetical protein
MLTACPKCDSMIPMNLELALKIDDLGIKCPCCEEYINPFGAEIEIVEQKIGELKDQLVISNSLNPN